MKRWAVSYIDFFDHNLTTVIVYAEDWQTALGLHPKTIGYEYNEKSLEEAKTDFWNTDAMIECVEIVI